jgi:hypothetical protein
MRVIAVLLVLAVSYGCENAQSTPFTPFAPSTPFAPTSPRPSPTPVPHLQYWHLTRTVADVTGSAICGGWPANLEVGRSSNWILETRRSTDDILMMYENDIDPVGLKGTVIGDAFDVSATRDTYLPCNGGRRDFQYQSRIVGRFNSDGKGITARETVSYRVDSSEVGVLHHDWSAQLWLDYPPPRTP